MQNIFQRTKATLFTYKVFPENQVFLEKVIKASIVSF